MPLGARAVDAAAELEAQRFSQNRRSFDCFGKQVPDARDLWLEDPHYSPDRISFPNLGIVWHSRPSEK